MKHYNWSLVEEEALNARISRKVIHTPNLTIARMRLQKHAVVPEHSHLNEQICTVESGALRFHIAGRDVTVRAGESLAIAANEPHSAEALEDTSVVDVFSPARQDWIDGNDAYLRG